MTGPPHVNEHGRKQCDDGSRANPITHDANFAGTYSTIKLDDGTAAHGRGR